ncbi:M14 family metallopeptidase [Cytophagaceae bacterium DM2B3-1]|uniref:M14 family metallopeptidase n=1 Tax=Xanthocytophaga flava TaxID=3048013 RepID=A0ABT7CMJ9_9BACT|nr:M14 family metallopeptidase [Xanthocytophaga flavus]MDJ1467534.1 M14 family metallopeptidase [Xanthocytophaga flavus]MDJ1494907.1 M14 family metallopeptidase [Xanthocytophaga flavus]
MKNFLLILTLSVYISSQAQKNEFQTKFEHTKGTETVTYQEGIEFLEKLDLEYDKLKLVTYGTTDIGKPLHLAILDGQQSFDPVAIRKSGRSILLVNNGIHPGEPDGVDASLMLLRNLLQNKKLQPLIQNTVICVIPFYNVDGILNRGKYSRANQNGPAEYGFRGNSRNYDLNRDFIKNDTKNAQTFVSIFREWQPDLFIDNHVSNGADYQYIMTYIAPQKNKLGGELGKYLDTRLVPELKRQMKEAKFEMTPYVNEFAITPDSAGIAGFLETARYSTGYTALFQTIGFMPETHMLKSFAQRVEGTYQFMLSMLTMLQTAGQNIQTLKQKDIEKIKTQTDFVVEWQLDKSVSEKIVFKGYEGRMIPSKVTTGKRLFYDRTKPYTKEIPYYNTFIPKTTIQKPQAYLIPQQWESIITRLKINKVELQQVSRDTSVEVEVYYIADYKTSGRAFEGHYPHSDVKLRKEKQTLVFRAGDYIVPCNQTANRYIVETLEPQATDSFFNWNFFDSILQQKEGYSDYVFEDLAEKLLNEKPELRKKLEDQKASDEKFRNNPRAQLDFVYKNSPYYEPSHLRYPVFRIL